MSKHPIVHIEIPSSDAKASAAFYAELFGWETVTDEQYNYTMWNPGDGPGGGFTNIDGENVNPGDVHVYVGTDDIEATLSKVESLGGTTAAAKTEIPGMGWYAFFTDPSGNKMALWTSANPE